MRRPLMARFGMGVFLVGCAALQAAAATTPVQPVATAAPASRPSMRTRCGTRPWAGFRRAVCTSARSIPLRTSSTCTTAASTSSACMRHDPRRRVGTTRSGTRTTLRNRRAPRARPGRAPAPNLPQVSLSFSGRQRRFARFGVTCWLGMPRRSAAVGRLPRKARESGASREHKDDQGDDDRWLLRRVRRPDHRIVRETSCLRGGRVHPHEPIRHATVPGPPAPGVRHARSSEPYRTGGRSLGAMERRLGC